MKLLSRLSNWFQPTLLLAILLFMLLMVGALVLQDFGEGVDEWHNTFYGKLFLSLYTRETLFQPTDVDYYNGPFYFMVFTVTSRIFTFVNPSWLLVDGRHLTNWITFLIGAFAFFNLGKQLFNKRVAWFALAGYLTQPLLIGHAFINQKDTPLMVFFLLSLTLGFRVLNAKSKSNYESASKSSATNSSLIRLIKEDQEHINANSKLAGVIGLLLFLCLLILELWFEWFSLPALKAIVINAYENNAGPIIQSLFDRFATDAYKTPVDLYLAKVDTAYIWLRPIATILLMVLFLLLLRNFFRATYRSKIEHLIRQWLPVILAGVVLGMTTSIRLAGLLAGALISLAYLYQLRSKSIIPIIIYWGFALITIYIAWPVLWGDPIGSLFTRILQTTDFTSHDVLYNGSLYPSDNLPWHYAPVLIGIQLTIPIVLLFFLGIFQTQLIRKDSEHSTVSYMFIWLWLLIPLLLAMSGTIPVYNNFRHILFAIPPILLFAGLGAVNIWQTIEFAWVNALLLGLFLLSGIIPIVKLHPYQYLYYNEFVGGVHGAEGRFELDYWCTSMREAMEFVNGVAPDGARVAVWGGYTTASPFRRDDIDLYRDWRTTTTPDFALGCNQAITSPKFFPQLNLIKAVQIDQATLSIIKASN